MKSNIFICINNLMIYRNYFHTGLNDRLEKYFSPIYLFDGGLVDFLIKNDRRFDIDNIKIEIVNFKVPVLFKLLHKLCDMFYTAVFSRTTNIKKMMLDDLYTLKIKILLKSLKIVHLDKLLYPFFCFITREFWPISREISFLINKHSPALVVSNFPQMQVDYTLIRTCKKISVPIVGMIYSWDNILSRPPIVIHPDKYIVWNEFVKEDILKYYKIQESNIVISGVPQFDPILFELNNINISKYGFYSRYNLDPKRKIVCFSTGEPECMLYEKDLISELIPGLLERNFQVIIRLHPLAKLEYYSELEKYHIIMMFPSRHKISFNGHWFITKEDYLDYARLLICSDIVVNIASTVAIEATGVNTPVFNLRYMPISYHGVKNDIDKWYINEHFSKIVKSNATHIVNSKKEFFKNIDKIIFDKKFNYKNRESLRLKFFPQSVENPSCEKISETLRKICDKSTH